MLCMFVDTTACHARVNGKRMECDEIFLSDTRTMLSGRFERRPVLAALSGSHISSLRLCRRYLTIYDCIIHISAISPRRQYIFPKPAWYRLFAKATLFAHRCIETYTIKVLLNNSHSPFSSSFSSPSSQNTSDPYELPPQPCVHHNARLVKRLSP